MYFYFIFYFSKKIHDLCYVLEIPLFQILSHNIHSVEISFIYVEQVSF